MTDFTDLVKKAAPLAARLKDRGESIACAESTMAGLVSAALVAQPGASSFYLGGILIYTRAAGRAMLDMKRADFDGLEPMTEPYAAALAEGFRKQIGADWALAEMGAAGPQGSPYGPGPGTAAMAVAGATPLQRIVTTGSADRVDNMGAFAEAALDLLLEATAR